MSVKSQKQKIAFVASYAPSLLNFRLALMQACLTQGHTVMAIAPEDAQVASRLAQLGIPFYPVTMQRNGMNPLADLKLLREFIHVFRKEKPDCVFNYTIKPVIYASLAAKWAGIPHIYSLITGAGYVFSEQTKKSRWVGRLAQQLMKQALRFNQTVIFQNPDNRDLFHEKKIISHKQATQIVNGSGIDCDAFQPTDFPPTLTFLMIARLLRDKGVREYFQAAAAIKKNHPHIRFQLVGWIDTNPNAITQDELDQVVEQGTIEFLGQLEDVRPAIAAASVYVLPSYHEGTPRTVLEAMAMGRPIITTHAPGCKETVIPHHNGLLVPVQDVDALIQAIRFYIATPEQIAAMGKASRKLALEKYNVHQVNRHLLETMHLV